MSFGWTDIDEIAISLDEAHPNVDPLTVRFDALRAMVLALDDFEPDPEHQVNEQILEAVQAAWIEEQRDRLGDDAPSAGDGGSSYRPNQPFR